MTSRRQSAQRSMAAAFRMRRRAGYDLREPICVYDLAERLGIEVRFVDIPSLEGMVDLTSGPIILVSSLRPTGRKAYTCGHELGHWALGHGTRLDEFLDHRPSTWRDDADERAAQCFAGALLMPKPAIDAAFADRHWAPSRCTATQALTLASLFGVGYETIVKHLCWGVGLIPNALATELLRRSALSVRVEVLGAEARPHMVIADEHWNGRAIDAEVGDVILAPRRTTPEGTVVERTASDDRRSLFTATSPGVGRLIGPNEWAHFVRVSRRGFVGRSVFRHLPE